MTYKASWLLMFKIVIIFILYNNNLNAELFCLHIFEFIGLLEDITEDFFEVIKLGNGCL